MTGIGEATDAGLPDYALGDEAFDEDMFRAQSIRAKRTMIGAKTLREAAGNLRASNDWPFAAEWCGWQLREPVRTTAATATRRLRSQPWSPGGPPPTMNAWPPTHAGAWPSMSPNRTPGAARTIRM